MPQKRPETLTLPDPQKISRTSRSRIFRGLPILTRRFLRHKLQPMTHLRHFAAGSPAEMPHRDHLAHTRRHCATAQRAGNAPPSDIPPFVLDLQTFHLALKGPSIDAQQSGYQTHISMLV